MANFLIYADAPAFTRPNDTTAYAAGDLVANSVTAGSVVALRFDFKYPTGVPIEFVQARFRKSGATSANAGFKLTLFSATPTFSTNGDNSPTSGNVVGAANVIGQLGMAGGMTAMTDGAVGFGMPVSNSIWSPTGYAIPWDSSLENLHTVFGIMEAMAAYTPVAQEIFNVTLSIRSLLA